MTEVASNAGSNAGSFARSVIGLLDAKDKTDSGAFSLINSHRLDVESLLSRVDHAKGIEGMSVRSVITDHFAASPEGERILERYAALVELKSGVSPDQRAEKAAYKRRINTVNVMLGRVVDVMSVVHALEEHNFEVRFRKVPNTGATVCKVRGKGDDDFASFNVSSVLKLLGKPMHNIDSYAGLQELSKSPKAGTPNEDKGNSDTVQPSRIAAVTAALDTAISGFDLSRTDNGMSPGARAKLIALWARLDYELTDAQKIKARAEFDADADKPDNAEAA